MATDNEQENNSTPPVAVVRNPKCFSQEHEHNNYLLTIQIIYILQTIDMIKHALLL